MKKALPALAAAILIAFNLSLPDWYESTLVLPHRAEEAAMLDLLGESRTVLARALWFKMDLFHEVLDDEGVDFAKQTEVLPLLRLVSLLDPSFVDAFDTIAWDLWKGHKQPEKALEIVEEGLGQNPGNVQLLVRKAMICISLERYEEAAEASRQALDRAGNDFDVLDAARVAWRSYKELGDQDSQRLVIQRALKVRPGDELWLRRQHELYSGA
ncbi:MAG: hypothetical protein KC910_20520 [Candidatus Eremiobacteraeota bacterium]|nr:hypothetical protein [Candidatus Eremiobacteraeota bacterium]